MAWVDDFVNAALGEPTAKGTGFTLELTTDSAYEPVSQEDLLAHAYLSRASATQIADILRLAKAARFGIERAINKSLMQQTWTQYYDRVHPTRGLPLHKGPYPVLSVESISYIANFEADTWLPWPSTNYTLIKGREVQARSSWPAHRGTGSLRVIYKTGYAALAASPDDAAVAAARAAIPADLVKAVKDLAAFYFENREGQGVTPKYEVTAKSQSTWPALVNLTVDMYRDRRFLS